MHVRTVAGPEPGAPIPCRSAFNLAAHVQAAGAGRHERSGFAAAAVAFGPGAPVIACVHAAQTDTDQGALPRNAAVHPAASKRTRPFVRVDVLPRTAQGRLNRRRLRRDRETAHGQA